MTEWQIREATAEDVAAIIALFGIADDAHAAGAPHQFRGAWAAPRSEREVLGLLENPDIALFVAELEGRVVGQVVVRIETVPENTTLVPRRFAKLHDLVVMPEARAQGIGRALVHATEQWSVARRMASIELTVWEFNGAARRLYEQLGYTTDARRYLRVLPVARA
jgi:ribosomal protein S18 acetylase RimI-like enzyme